jgi:K+-transporting ATPase ATPase A chain
MAGNGSEFSGLGNNTVFWNLTTSVVMLCGRFLPIVGALAIAGSLRQKKPAPFSGGSLTVDSSTFGAVLFILIILLNALSFLPAFMLGPLAEHLSLH